MISSIGFLKYGMKTRSCFTFKFVSVNSSFRCSHWNTNFAANAFLVKPWDNLWRHNLSEQLYFSKCYFSAERLKLIYWKDSYNMYRSVLSIVECAFWLSLKDILLLPRDKIGFLQLDISINWMLVYLYSDFLLIQSQIYLHLYYTEIRDNPGKHCNSLLIPLEPFARCNISTLTRDLKINGYMMYMA